MWGGDLPVAWPCKTGRVLEKNPIRKEMNMRGLVRTWFLGALLLLAAAGSQAAQVPEYVGKVDHVFDGQTVRIYYRGGQIRVRLPALETPEPLQAKRALTDLVAGKTVRVTEIRWDNGYLIGHVSVGDKDVRTELVREGHARVASSGLAAANLDGLQDKAREADLGIWAQR